MNIYNLHDDPKSLDHHEQAHDEVVDVFWGKYNFSDLKEREPAIAKHAAYSYEYARNFKDGFKLGEPAIKEFPFYLDVYIKHFNIKNE